MMLKRGKGEEKKGYGASSHGMAEGDLMFFRASRYVRSSPRGSRRSSNWRRICFSLFESLLSRVRTSCEVVDDARVADYNAATIVEKFCSFLHSRGEKGRRASNSVRREKSPMNSR